MSKSNYQGNLSKEEQKLLEEERQERLSELQDRKEREKSIRKKRNNRHLDWSGSTDE